MRDDFGALWALSPSTQRRAPTPTEIAGGFPCGPFDIQLFNEMMFALSSVLAEANGVLDAAAMAPNANNNTQLAAAIQALIAAGGSGGSGGAGLAGFPKLVALTVGQTYTPSTKTRRVAVLGRAAGGAGGSSTANNTGGGGGAGGGFFALIDAAGLTGGVPVTIGAGGTAVTGTPFTGNTGGSCAFGSYASATGGLGGKISIIQSGPGSYGDGGDGGQGSLASGVMGFAWKGQPGENGNSYNGGSGGGTLFDGAGIGGSDTASRPNGGVGGFGAGGGGGDAGGSAGAGGQAAIFVLEMA